MGFAGLGQHSGVGRDSLVSRVLGNVSEKDLETGGENDLEMLVQHLGAATYGGTSLHFF